MYQFISTTLITSIAAAASAFGAVVFSDDFNDASYSPPWTVTLQEDASGYEAWFQAFEGAGKLTVTRVPDFNPDNSTWGKAIFSYDLPGTITGDFTAQLDFSWNQIDVTSMQAFFLDLHASGDTVARGGMVDAWIGSTGSPSATIGGSSFYTGSNTLPLGDLVHLAIERVGNYITVFFDNNPLFSGVAADAIDEVRLEFWYYNSINTSSFSPITVDNLSIDGDITPVPEPATAALAFGFVILCAVGYSRARRRLALVD